MIRFARPARKRSGRRQKRLARIRAGRLTLHERRALRDEWLVVWKEEARHTAAQAEDDYPGLSYIVRETFGLARERSRETGWPPLSILKLYCQAMERYLTGTYRGDLVQSEAVGAPPAVT